MPPLLPDTYLAAHGALLLFVVGGLCFVVLGLLVARALSVRRPNPEKNATYECGEETEGPAWVPLNARFYVVALVFVLFDVELVFLLPWATAYARPDLQAASDGAWGRFALAEMGVFVALLAVALAWAWRAGHLDWIKPRPVVPTVPNALPTAAYARFRENTAVEEVRG
jgi:NADH-quinone oxidoreductase subunit A